MKKYYYFIVEGVHDIAAISRFLRQFKISQVQSIEQLDSFWDRTIPRSFPHNGNLLKRVPVPMFFQNEEMSIAIQAAGGDSGIADAFDGLMNIDYENLKGIAAFCDADKLLAKERFKQIHELLLLKLDSDFKEIIDDVKFNEVKQSATNFGIFVFPNNQGTGTLEHMLLEGGEVVYADLLKASREYIVKVDQTYKKKWSQSSEVKVLFGATANILKPGKANQVSIQDNDWINEKTITETSQNKMMEFLQDLFS